MQGQPNLNCKQMEEALDAYYDLELSPEEAEAVELHLADCAACTANLADIDAVVNQLKSLPAVEWSGDLSDAIEARILAQADAPLEAKSASKPENVVSIQAGSSSSSSQGVARGGFFKPRYILASVASILALFFAYNQFVSNSSSRQAPVAEVAQAPTPELLPSEKEAAGIKDLKKPVPKLPSDNSHELASSNQTKVERSVDTAKQAAKPDMTPPSKPAKEETITEKMLANNKQGDRDNNKDNVNDSEEIVATYDYENIDSASDFGINTNEDGLYAIKL